jgi:hypothetical protein
VNLFVCRPKLIICRQKRGRPDKTKKAFSSCSSQTDSDTSKPDNSSLLVDRILNANKRIRDRSDTSNKDIDDTANDADMNLSNESDESDDIIIESYVCPSSKGPNKGVKCQQNFINTLLVK